MSKVIVTGLVVSEQGNPVDPVRKVEVKFSFKTPYLHVGDVVNCIVMLHDD